MGETAPLVRFQVMTTMNPLTAETIVAPALARGTRSTTPPPVIGAGAVLFGEYEVVEGPLGGGMGHVYRCRHRSTGGWRAIKVIRPEMDGQSGIESMFIREAEALLKVRNDAVVHCHDLLREGDRAFLVMEYVEGPSLRELLAKRRLAPDEVLSLRDRIASGLAAAHANGVIHRDVSPDNIVLPRESVELAKLIDFGVAASTEASCMTLAQDFKGKLAYASPEQFGIAGTRINDRSDIYSLGLVLAEAASGSPLAMGTTPYEAIEIRRNIPRLPASVPAGLRDEILPLLNPDPKMRPGASSFANARRMESDTSPQPVNQELTGKAVLSAILIGLLFGFALFLYAHTALLD